MMQLIRALDRVVEWLGTIAAIAAAAILAFVTGHILLEIAMRNVFDTSTFAVDELVGFGVGAMTVLSMAQTLRRGEMIRVHILLTRLPTRKRRLMELGCALLALVPVAMIGQAFVVSALRNWQEHSVTTGLLQVPLWVPEAIFAIGLLLLALQLATYAARLLLDPGATIVASDVTTE